MKRRLSIPADRAAYQASQPLFDALKNGCEKLEEPLNLLKTTRDLSQQIHVQVDKDAAKRCIEYSLQSLTQTLQVHERILTELAEICHPTLSETTASSAYDLISKLQTQLRKSSETLQSSNTINSAHIPASPDTTKKPKLDMPHLSHDTATTTSDTTSNTPVPGVQYTDVTAEIEARLLAKEQKRQAKKDSKKRKRSSVDSIGSVSVGVIEQPSAKKKARVAQLVNGMETKPVVANGGAEGVVRVKRKQRRSGSGEPGVERNEALKPRKRVRVR